MMTESASDRLEQNSGKISLIVDENVNARSPSSLKYSSLRRAERRLQLHAQTDEEKQIWADPHPPDNRHSSQWKPSRVVLFRKIQFPTGQDRMDLFGSSVARCYPAYKMRPKIKIMQLSL